MMVNYMSDVAEEMSSKSAKIRRDFAQHRLSAGENRQDLVGQFLVDHLPKRFGVDTGFVISRDDQFSKQADLMVVDKENNVPLYPDYRNRLWPVESVYALIEVKTHLNPDDLDDCISKGQRFKSLTREFCQTRTPQHTKNSLFVIWAFESPEPKLLKEHLVERLRDIDVTEQPDLVVIPDVLVAHMGQYGETARLGEPGSKYRRDLERKHQGDLSDLTNEPLVVYALGQHSLLGWYVWLDSWLRQAGSRFCDPIRYLPKVYIFGTQV